MTGLIPSAWQPDFFTGLFFFAVEVLFIAALLPVAVGALQRRREGRVWRSARTQLLQRLQDFCIEVMDAMKLIDWAIRSWIQYNQAGDAGRVARYPVRGRNLISLANEIDDYIDRDAVWSRSDFAKVMQILIMQILFEVGRARSQIDVLAMAVNEEMAEAIGESLNSLGAAEDAARVLIRHLAFLGIELEKSAPANERLDLIDQQVRDQLSSDLGVPILMLTPQAANARALSVAALTFASQIRALIAAYPRMLASVIALRANLRGKNDLVEKDLEVSSAAYSALQLCLAADEIANTFTDIYLREWIGAGWSLQQPPVDFVRNVFAPLGVSPVEERVSR